MRASRLVELVQNPAIGALAIWQFVIGYYSESQEGVSLDYLYAVLPLVSNPEIREVVCHTNGGLLAYRAKLSKDGRNNAILGASEMAADMYGLSSKSLRIAIACDLVKQGDDSLCFVPALRNMPSGVALSKIEQAYKKTAARLGKQMSRMAKGEVSSILGVRF